MLRVVLIATAACVLLVAVMALTRGMGRPSASRVEAPEPVAAAPRATQPATAKAPEPEPVPPSAPEEAVPADQQMEDDAAAVGMTTREAEEPPAEPQT